MRLSSTSQLDKWKMLTVDLVDQVQCPHGLLNMVIESLFGAVIDSAVFCCGFRCCDTKHFLFLEDTFFLPLLASEPPIQKEMVLWSVGPKDILVTSLHLTIPGPENENPSIHHLPHPHLFISLFPAFLQDARQHCFHSTCSS